ncbi:acyl-CoA dehydrogenase family protein [Nocardia wallacei]|uniref:acyl-CoA dehydrogenase family protein n=1 Tax=Nocardia wallacei TaxID=480035 RepID=UPI002456EF04|nr:acyl-CoA dehydrogenase family protein [Nocardia wallacei]
MNTQLSVRDAVTDLGDRPAPESTPYAEKASAGYELLGRIVADLGGSSRAIASHAEVSAALFDWSAILAPRLLPVLSGHLNLTVGAIERLGNGSAYQRQLLAELDSMDSMGVMLLTEGSAGSAVTEQQTRAEWHAEDGGYFVFTTAAAGAYKWMGNVGDHTPRTVIVTARLIVDGTDEGVFPFLVRLRDTADGALADGVRVVSLPERAGAPMDNAMTAFMGLRAPADALLCGDWARWDTDGRFRCDLSLPERSRRAIGQLQAGRVSLASAAVAAARAGLALTWSYASNRLTSGGVLMSDRDGVQFDLVSATAQVYAMTTLANAVRHRIAAAPASTASAMLAMLAKPVLSRSAREVLQTCRELATAQGLFRVNHLADWIDAAECVITAEGDNKRLQIATGGQLGSRRWSRADHERLAVRDADEVLPWWHRMLVDREQTMLDDAQEGELHGVVVTGPDRAAIEIAVAVSERLASEALATAADTVTDPIARAIVDDLAAVFALECVDRHAGWFAARGRMTPDLSITITNALARRHASLVPHLSMLVDAFAIPLEVLDAPIDGDPVPWWLNYAGWQDMSAIGTQEAVR